MRTLAWMARNTTLASGQGPAGAPQRRRLVATERGATSVEAAFEDTSFEETVLVADAGAGTMSALALRVSARLAGLERQKRALSSATLVLGGARDSQTVATREAVARVLLTHLQASGGAELILLASSSERDALLALAEKLLRELETRGVAIRIQFRPSKAQRSARASTPALATWAVS